MTLGDLVKLVRESLIDTTVGSYRWSNSMILTALKEGVLRLNKDRPESRYVGLRLTDNNLPVTDDANQYYVEATALAYTLTIDERWHEALVYFAKGKCLSIDSSDQANMQLASDAFTTFERLAQT
jgi:hypothetical protein